MCCHKQPKFNILTLFWLFPACILVKQACTPEGFQKIEWPLPHHFSNVSPSCPPLCKVFPLIRGRVVTGRGGESWWKDMTSKSKLWEHLHANSCAAISTVLVWKPQMLSFLLSCVTLWSPHQHPLTRLPGNSSPAFSHGFTLHLDQILSQSLQQKSEKSQVQVSAVNPVNSGIFSGVLRRCECRRRN